MKNYNKDNYASLLIKGDLKGAIDYVRQFPELVDTYEKYQSIFKHHQVWKRSNHQVINEIDAIYQDYYKAIFWLGMDKEDASQKLFIDLWTYVDRKDRTEPDESIEEYIKQMVSEENFIFLGGRTAGLFGPYIWKSTSHESYEVELPTGIEIFHVTMMDGFISRSWLDFISLGSVGTGGWIGQDGTLCCIRDCYDQTSDNFHILFLKHEAQHAVDKREFPALSSVELEYRAKLIELIYWKDERILASLFMEGDDSDEGNSHSFSSHLIIKALTKKLFGEVKKRDLVDYTKQLNTIKEMALTLLHADTQRLRSRDPR